MPEYWFTYDVATGAPKFRSEGVARRDLCEPGEDLLVLPKAAFGPQGIDLDAIKVALHARIDADAELLRRRYITPGEGQAMTYLYKAAEARAWAVDHSAPTPFLAAEATARGVTMAQLVPEVLAQVALWVLIGSRIDARRIAAKAAVLAAVAPEAALVAGTIDWNALAA